MSTAPQLPILMPPVINGNDITMIGGNQSICAAPLASLYLRVQNMLGNDPVTVNPAGDDASVSGFVLEAGQMLELPRGTNRDVNVSGTAGDVIYAVFGF